MKVPYMYEVNPAWARTFKNHVDGNLKVVCEYLKDVSKPLEERWEVYQTLLKMFRVESSYWTPRTLSNAGFQDTWYDDFYIDRGAVQLFDDRFIERATEKFVLRVEELKEEILQKGIGGFVYDW